VGVSRAILENTSSWRVIAARHPPIALFERVASLDEFDALYELEMAYSAHYDETTLLQVLPRSEWVFGPGSGYVMAPFAYRSTSRFSDGTFGVYYAGLDEGTAIREVAFHRGQFLATTQEPPCVLEELILRAKISGDLTDIRGEQAVHPEWYDSSPLRYEAPQALGASLWRSHETGLAFASVRHSGRVCVGIFRPKAINNCRQSRPLRYLWDGEKIAGWA
jgi:hypothetical protein